MLVDYQFVMSSESSTTTIALWKIRWMDQASMIAQTHL